MMIRDVTVKTPTSQNLFLISFICIFKKLFNFVNKLVI